MLKYLKEQVYLANQRLVNENLVILTWGNVSAYDKETGYVVIKPSGVPYKSMEETDMVVMDIDLNIVEGRYKPSSDAPSHIAMYKHWDKITSIVHTHSLYATSWAQAGLDIVVQGTTHADYFYGDIPCISCLSREEVQDNYEYYTGLKIVNEFKERRLNPLEMGACLINGHAPFTWGTTIDKAVENSVVLEMVSNLSLNTVLLNDKAKLPEYLLNAHYLRKHGENSYYGQN